MNRLYIFCTVVVLSILSGCINPNKYKFEKIENARVVSASLTSSEISVTARINNTDRKDIEVLSAEVECVEIDNLTVSLGHPVSIMPGVSSVEIPVNVNYSLGSVFSILNKIGKSDQYTLVIHIKVSRGGASAKSIKFRKKVSRSQLSSLAARIKKI